MSGEAEQRTGEDTGAAPGLAADAAVEPDVETGDPEPGDPADPTEAADPTEPADRPAETVAAGAAEGGGADPLAAPDAPAHDEPAAGTGVGPVHAAADVRAEQDVPSATPSALRVDYGAHLEATYPRLVAQLYAITLDAAEAHDVVQDAYSRAWRRWAEVGRSPDPAAWVRRVAVRSTIRSWRRLAARLLPGRGHRRLDDETDPRTRALLAALGRLAPGERRAVVLFHMAGVPAHEIAAIERVSADAVYARLHRARTVVIEGMADVLTAVLGTDEELEYR